MAMKYHFLICKLKLEQILSNVVHTALNLNPPLSALYLSGQCARITRTRVLGQNVHARSTVLYALHDPHTSGQFSQLAQAANDVNDDYALCKTKAIIL